MEYSFQEKLYIWLSNVFEMSVISADKLISLNGGIERLHDAALSGTVKFPDRVSLEKAERFKLLAPIQHIDDLIAGLEAYSVRAITRASKEYPKELKEIYDPPLVLYARGSGSLADAKLPFAIIGSRHCTDYGERMARLFAQTLACNGMTIVSGLAYGCDAMAAQGALSASDNKIPTIAILGQGVLVEKHDSTAKLMEEILARGLVLSEMLPSSGASRGSYPMRNRIISGMSRGLLVVEAGERSGTMITANAAMEQGRMLFAIPGRITDRMSMGTNYMIKCGAAQAVYDTADIMDHYGMQVKNESVRELGAELNALADGLNGDTKKVYGLIRKGEKSFDTICDLSGIAADKLNLYLTELEFSGLIKQLPGRVYVAE